MKMPFGKYAGEEITEIEDTQYLKWVLEECKDISTTLWDEINEEVENRRE